MDTLKIPYNEVSYPLYLTPTKVTTPSLKVGNLGYAFLAQGKALGDPMLYGSSILKGAPLKVSKNGVSYRSTYKHGTLGTAQCTLTYYTAYSAVEGTQVVTVCTRYNQYGQCIAWGHQTQYRYYWNLKGYLKISDFTISNSDCRLVISSMSINDLNVNDTNSVVSTTSSNWGNWTTTRYSNYPTKPTTTLKTTATGRYELQINNNGEWVTIKTGVCTCPVSLSFNSTSTQTKTVTLTLL